MSKWSKELQEKTKNELFLGAMVKDEEHNFGFVVAQQRFSRTCNPDFCPVFDGFTLVNMHMDRFERHFFV